MDNVFRKLRKEKNPNQMEDYKIKDLSKDLGIAAPKISELENGKRSASLSELQAYHKHFNVPYEYLLGESESRYYSNMALSSELGLTGDSIEFLKQTFRLFNGYKHNSSDRVTPEGRTLRTINFLLERWNPVLRLIGQYLDSANSDADSVQIQYVPFKNTSVDCDDPDFIKQRFGVNGFNCEVENQEYEIFCEMYLREINDALRNKWKIIHANYKKEHATKKAPDTN